MHDTQSPHCQEISRIRNEQHDLHSTGMHSTSIYWHAHSTSEQPEGVPTSEYRNNNGNHKAGSDIVKPLMPAKRAKLSELTFKQASACKGNCPRVWTIESYCEACHG